jgi:hypothetical protein
VVQTVRHCVDGWNVTPLRAGHPPCVHKNWKRRNDCKYEHRRIQGTARQQRLPGRMQRDQDSERAGDSAPEDQIPPRLPSDTGQRKRYRD